MNQKQRFLDYLEQQLKGFQQIQPRVWMTAQTRPVKVMVNGQDASYNSISALKIDAAGEGVLYGNPDREFIQVHIQYAENNAPVIDQVECLYIDELNSIDSLLQGIGIRKSQQ